MKLSFLIIILAATFVLVSSAGLQEEFTWTRLSYLLTSDTGRTSGRQYRRRGVVTNYPDAALNYIYKNNIPMGANVWGNKLFITVPRRLPGIPSTLNYVRLDGKKRHNVPLVPYPNCQTNQYPPSGKVSENLVSIYRVAIDPCDRLWALDTGVLEMGGNFTRVKPPTIIAINLFNNEIIHKYQIPEDRWRLKPGQTIVTVDVTEDRCDDAYLYIPDFSSNDLTVYSLKQNKSWLITHSYFKPLPDYVDLSVAGYHFQWFDGIFSVELSDLKSDGFRDMYFHAMASPYMYKISTQVLRNENLATSFGSYITIIGDRGNNSQSSAADIDKAKGIMFLSLASQNALACWNIKKPLDTISIVQKNDDRMIYLSDVKVYNNKVYVLTNSMPVFGYGSLDYNEINFRVWTNTVEGAIANTACV